MQVSYKWSFMDSLFAEQSRAPRETGVGLQKRREAMTHMFNVGTLAVVVNWKAILLWNTSAGKEPHMCLLDLIHHLRGSERLWEVRYKRKSRICSQLLPTGQQYLELCLFSILGQVRYEETERKLLGTLPPLMHRVLENFTQEFMVILLECHQWHPGPCRGAQRERHGQWRACNRLKEWKFSPGSINFLGDLSFHL